MILALISGLLILDKFAVGIFGFSQPIVASLIFGLIFGDLYGSLILGSYFQLMYLALMPIGRVVPADGELGAITGLAIYAAYPDLPISVPFFFGVATSIFSGYTDILFRQFNNVLYHKGLSAAEKKNPNQIVLYHLLGLPFVFVRGFLTVLLMIFVVGLFDMILVINSPNYYLVSIAVGFSSGLYLFFKTKNVAYLIAGVGIGWALQFFAG